MGPPHALRRKTPNRLSLLDVHQRTGHTVDRPSPSIEESNSSLPRAGEFPKERAALDVEELRALSAEGGKNAPIRSDRSLLKLALLRHGIDGLLPARLGFTPAELPFIVARDE